MRSDDWFRMEITFACLCIRLGIRVSQLLTRSREQYSGTDISTGFAAFINQIQSVRICFVPMLLDCRWHARPCTCRLRWRKRTCNSATVLAARVEVTGPHATQSSPPNACVCVTNPQLQTQEWCGGIPTTAGLLHSGFRLALKGAHGLLLSFVFSD